MSGRPPIGRQETKNGPDVSVHLNAARDVAGTVMTIDGSHPGDLEALPAGAVCTLMIMLDRELQAAIEILEYGGAS